MTPSLDQTTSESYVWAHPGCPVRILLSLGVIEQLQAEVSQTASWRGEIGGLLIRSKRSKPGTIRIVDFIPLPGERTSDSHFKLPPESLAEAIARCPSDTKIAGYYRTDADQSIHLRPEDLATIQQWFKDPTSVFLVIASADPSRSTAGFFFWEDGSVGSNSSLTFPFSAAKLVSEGWPTQADSRENDRLANLSERFWQIADFVRRTSLPVKIGTISALFALIVGIRVFTWNRATNHSRAAAPPSLGLQVKRDGSKFQVGWNPSAPDIVNAKDANLVIWDGSREAFDGSADPLYMPLTSAQLRSGAVTYTSFAFTEKVKFRLDTISSSGDASSESVVSVSPVDIANPPPIIPTAELNARVTVPQARPAVPVLPPTERLPRVEPRRSPVTPAIPSDGQVKPRSSRLSRTFVPPKSRNAAGVAGETLMPDPPNIAANPARASSSITPEYNLHTGSIVAPPVQSNAAPLMRASLRPGTMVAPPIGQSNEGVVTITSEPSGARVEINAIPAGVTPLTLQISPVGLGFTVTVTKSGFAKWTIQSFSTAHPYSLHAQLRELSK